MKRKTKRQLAEREVDSFVKPTYFLDAKSARFRCIHMWLRGHDSARRAAAKRRPKAITGEQLYALWMTGLERQSVGTDAWPDVTDADKDVWEFMASKLTRIDVSQPKSVKSNPSGIPPVRLSWDGGSKPNLRKK